MIKRKLNQNQFNNRPIIKPSITAFPIHTVEAIHLDKTEKIVPDEPPITTPQIIKSPSRRPLSKLLDSQKKAFVAENISDNQTDKPEIANPHISKPKPRKHLPKPVNPPAVTRHLSQQANEAFDVRMYEAVELNSEQFQQLTENAVSSVYYVSQGKARIVPVVKTRTAYAVNTGGTTLEWLCSGFTIMKKVKSPNGEVYADIQTEDETGVTNVRISVDHFHKDNLKTLSKYGITVSSGLELTASIYFQKLLDSMKMESAEQQLGFCTNSGKIRFSGYDDGTLTSHTTYKSDDAYLEEFSKLIHESIPIQYLLSASMSAALMTVLNMQFRMNLKSYIINVVGDSSTGKTVAGSLCASAWTDPKSDKIFTSSLSTNNAMFKRLSGRFGIPMFLDESTIIGINTSEFGYTISEEREKHRLNPDCTEKTSGTWNTVIVMTSEEHFHDSSKSQNGGLVVRIHNAETLAFTNSSEHSDEIENFISQNYGIIGKLFTEWVLNHTEKLKKFYEDSRQFMRKFTADSHNNYTERLVNTYALTYLSANILKKLGLEIDCQGVAKIMQKQNITISTEYDMAENALQVIKEYVSKDPYNSKINAYCYVGNQNAVTSVAIPEKLTEKILADAGFRDLKVTIKALDKAGYLIRQGKDNGLKSKLHINKVNTVCYQFRFALNVTRSQEKLLTYFG